MRKSVVDLIEAYGVSFNGLRDLFVLEMIDAAKAVLSREQPGKEKCFTEEANALITNIEIEAAKEGALFHDTRDMLCSLKDRKIRTGVITRNCQSAVTLVFPDIFEYCNSVVTRDMSRNVKPHPEHLMVVLRELEVVPQFASIIGDHPMDIKIGKDVGVLTIGVLSGYSTSADLIKAGADIILNKAADIINILP
jgi:phosphoglycolate phosphatase